MELINAAKTLTENNWVSEVNTVHGLWCVGPEDESGNINVLGMGPDLISAIEMALRSKKVVA